MCAMTHLVCVHTSHDIQNPCIDTYSDVSLALEDGIELVYVSRQEMQSVRIELGMCNMNKTL